MELLPFSVINRYLSERLLRSNRYSGKDFSFVKIFQHGISFALTRNKKKLIRNYINWPIWAQRVLYFVKSKKEKAHLRQIPGLKEIVILDQGRAVRDEEGRWHSIYFDRIASMIPREKLTIIATQRLDLIQYDFALRSIPDHHPSLDREEMNMLREIKMSLKNARQSKQFKPEELKYIQASLHVFFVEFRRYYQVFKNQPTKRVIFTCHYHNEGLLAALKILNIECVEIQHGLIAKNDMYYVYHEQFAHAISRGFFPDKIIVYGRYWKSILEAGCEFRSHQIQIGGDYLFRLKSTSYTGVPKENLVVICSQKNLHEDYVAYGRLMASYLKSHPDWKCIIKLHPLEQKKHEYDCLKELGLEIADVEVPLDSLLTRCKLQISIYSTTFFDALGMDVINFSLQDFGNMSDYARDVVEEKVAIGISAQEDPIAKFLNTD
ncbi:MAG: hypothetical protein ACKO6L_02610 [Flavobacteriales bacterium]